ncbi:GNAT family N-acetyltransferase [Luedemannella flava]
MGFVGLIMDGRAGRVDPIVVSAARRGHGVGRGLVSKVADEARRRGLARLTVSPGARDDSALRSLHAAGFDTVATVTLSLDLRGGPGSDEPAGDSILLHGLNFST